VLAVVVSWLAGMPAPSAAAVQAGALADLVEDDPSVLSVQDLAARLGISTRTAERLARRYIGTAPGAMIRRRRLQRAAARLREDTSVSFAALAAETGYADQAHFSRDFRAVVGSTPTQYRAALT
jgi:transcriptional regulator GlxA family with amidase domain